ncbi:hypothetical protein [Falsiroseomonas sp. CW058]|uniref:hypothetical protein n=1 Tax=Falsiroseomonas sp. CW058 TaxID=3388664 RepID=UPI003D31AA63
MRRLRSLLLLLPLALGSGAALAGDITPVRDHRGGYGYGYGYGYGHGGRHYAPPPRHWGPSPVYRPYYPPPRHHWRDHRGWGPPRHHWHDRRW